MVAIVTGAGLGLERSSGWVLGSRGTLGDADFGRYGENVYVNAATGNLVIDRTDEILIGRGPDDVISRNYNSLAPSIDDNGDNWRLNAQRQVTGLTGTLNSAGSFITLIDWDGSYETYNWDTQQLAYICQSAGQAYHRLTSNGTTWTWTDGRSGVTEAYNSAGLITATADADGNALTYAYTSNRLTRVTTADGGHTDLTWVGNNITQVTTTSDSTVLSRVRYGYDTSNRLHTVTVDLTPNDQSVTDNNTVVTTYSYDGTSRRITSIIQTTGNDTSTAAELDISYGADNRVAQITQSVTGAITSTTNFSYDTTNRVTSITDAQSNVTKLTYDANGQLVREELPPAQAGATAPVIVYSYNSNGDVTSVTDANGNTTTYSYDGNDNLVFQEDQSGNVVQYTYNTDNMVIAETHYIDPAMTGPNRPPVANNDSYTVAQNGSITFDPRTNDSDPDGDTLMISSVSTPAHGTVAITNSGTTITYTPTTGYSGSDSFSYIIADGASHTATATVSVAVGSTSSPTNQPPVAHDDSVTVNENSSSTFDPRANDSDPDGDTLTISNVSVPSNGTAAITNNGTQITYTPNRGYSGSDNFTYTVSDGAGHAATATVSVTVVNQPPNAEADYIAVDRDSSFTFDPRANDSDPEGDPLTIVSVSSPLAGTATIVNGGTQITYTRTAGYYGQDIFTYWISDGHGHMDVSVVMVHAKGEQIDKPPVANSDYLTVNQGSSITFDPRSNDSDPENESLTVVGVSTCGGTAVIANGGSQITYTAPESANWNRDIFYYLVSDSAGNTSLSTVQVDINRVPVAGNDRISLTQNSSITFDPRLNDYDQDFGTLTIVNVAPPVHGTATIVNGGTQIAYTPAAGYYGEDSFAYTISDGQGGTATATVLATVYQNCPPDASDDYVTAEENSTITFDPRTNDRDLDGGALTIIGVSSPTYGTATIADAGTKVIYTPSAGYVGPDSFAYTISDGCGGTSTGTVAVNVVNSAPTANADSITVGANNSITFDPRVNDSDPNGDALTIVDVSTPRFGTATVVNGGTQIIYAASDSWGGDSFTYTITDGAGNYTTETVSVQVSRAPDISNDHVSVGESSSITFDPRRNDSDPYGGALTIIDASAPGHGVIAIAADGSGITYTPTFGYYGSDSFTYTVSNGAGGRATANVSMDVTYRAPEAIYDSIAVSPNNSITFDPRINDSNPSGNLLTIIAVSRPTYGAVTIVNDGKQISYTAPGSCRPDSFTYTLSDGAGHTATATVLVQVDTPPIATGDNIEVAANGSITFDPRSNDSDPDNDSLTIVGVSSPAHGTATVGYGGNQIIYTPTAGYHGQDVFSYTLTDGFGVGASAIISVIVDSPPTANNESITVNANGTITFDPRSNDTDPDGDAVIIVSVSQPWYGAVAIANDGTQITYSAPTWGTYFSDNFTYTISDGLGNTATATVHVTINQPPVANIDGIWVGQDGSVTFDPRANDTDPDGDALAIASVSPPSNGTASIINGTQINYTPTIGYYGTDSFSYTISDGHGNTAMASVSVTVARNYPPHASGDSISVGQNGSITFNPRTNDTDPDGDALTIVSASTPSHGTAAIISGSQITYTPTTGYYGTDSFSYAISDGHGNTATATVSVTISRPPVVNNDTITVNQNSSITFDPRSNDSDSDGDTLTIAGVSTPSHGTATIVGGSQIIYTPTTGYYGGDSFTYTISDGHGNTASGSVSVTVSNGPPVANNDSITVNQNSSITFNPRSNDSDPDGDTLTLTSVSTPSHGTATIVSGNSQITYTPTAGYYGADSYTYTISDGHGNTASATVSVTINQNLPPIANGDSITVNQNSSITFNPRSNDSDPDGDALTITGVSVPSHGTASIVSGSSQITYTPTVGYYGADSFTYTISDGVGHTATATVSVTVNQVNQAPVANTDSIMVNAGSSVTFDPRSNDSDPDGDSLTITSVSSPRYGTVTIVNGGTQINYTASSYYYKGQSDSFTYTISDGHGHTSTATVSVQVNALPVSNIDYVSVNENSSITFDPRSNDSDPDGDTLTIIGVSTPLHGTATIASGTQITYTPTAGYYGTDAFTYTVSDGHGATTSATVSVTVVNQPPFANSDSITVDTGSSVTFDPRSNDSDPDGGTLTITDVSCAGYGTAMIVNDGTQITYIAPTSYYSSSDTFTYTISDGQGNTATATVSVLVTQNQPPVANTDSITVNAGSSVTFDPRSNDSDPDGDPLTIASVSSPQYGTATIVNGGTQITYTPPSGGGPGAGGAGWDSFTYTISDGHGHSATATVSVTISQNHYFGANSPSTGTDDVGADGEFGTIESASPSLAGVDTSNLSLSPVTMLAANLTASSTTVSPAGAATSRYVYDSHRHLRFVISAKGEVTEYQYNSFGQQVASVVYRDNVYDVSGLNATQTPSVSDLTAWASGIAGNNSVMSTGTTYDFRGNISSVTSSETTVTYTYDQAGNLLTRQTSGIANGEVFTYDGLNRVTTAVDLNNAKTKYSYNDGNNTVSLTLANGLTETSVYNQLGELISYTESGSGIITSTDTYEYDDLGNLRMATDATGHSSYYLYDADGRKIADIAADGSLTEYRYDAGSRLVETISYATSLTHEKITSLADASSSSTSVTLDSIRPDFNPGDGWSWRVYDNANRVIEKINGDGDVTTFTYGSFSNIVSTTSYSGKLHADTIASLKSTPPTALVLPTADVTSDSVTRNFYDADGRLIGRLDGLGNLSEIKYNGAGQKVETIAFANTISSSLWTSGSLADLLASVGTSSGDVHTRYFYDGRGLLRYTLDAALHPTEYLYDAAGNLQGVIEYAGTIASTTNYTFGYLQTQTTSLASNNDRKNWSVYDAAGRVAYSVDASGAVVVFSYDAVGNVVKQVRYAAAVTQMAPTMAPTIAWLDSGTSTSQDRTTRFVYDAKGELVYNIDAEGYVTEYQYDPAGRKTLEIRYADPYSVTDAVTQSSLAAQIGSVPSTAVQTKYAYDIDGRLSDSYDGLNVRTHFVYDALGHVKDCTLGYGTSDAVTTHYEYDAAGRVTTKTLACGTTDATTVQFSYDGLGNMLIKTDGRGNSTKYTYDALGHVRTVTIPIDGTTSAVTTNTYDSFGNLSTSTDALNNTAYYYYDVLGRLTLQVDANKYATGTAYTIFGDVESVTRYATQISGTATAGTLPSVQANADHDATTRFEYDGLGRVTKVTDAEGYYEQYKLNAFGDRITVQNKLGGVTSNVYDRRSLLVSETMPINSVQILLYMGTGTAIVEAKNVTNLYSYDARGNRTKSIEASGLSEQRVTQYSYDKLDRLTSTVSDAVQVVDSGLKTATDPVNPTTTNTYDSLGNVIQTKDPTGARTLYYYDHLGEKIGELNALGTLSTWMYDKNGNAISQRVYTTQISLPSTPGGTVPVPISGDSYRETLYAYDAANRLTTTTVASLYTGQYGSSFVASSSNVIVTNIYDKDGNVVRQNDGRGNSVFYYYDKCGRKIAQIDQENYLTYYTLDADGNVAKEERFAAKIASQPTTLSDPVALAASVRGKTNDGASDRVTTFTYDGNGRRLTETRTGVEAYSVDADSGAMSLAATSATVTYTYNGLGEVTSKREATGDTTSYGYDLGGRQISITNASIHDAYGDLASLVTQEEYDGLNNLTHIVEKNAQAPYFVRETFFVYGAGGRLHSMTDASGFTRTFGYDAAGRTVMVSYNRLTGVWLGGVSTVTEAQATRYDLLGRAIYQSVAGFDGSNWSFGDYSQTTYNAYGEVSSRAVNGVTQETYDYDNGGRLWRSTVDGITTLNIYDANGNKTMQITSDGNAPSGASLSSLTSSQAVSLLLDKSYNVPGMVATITVFDKRGQAIQGIEPHRQLSSNSTTDISTRRTYNAFGEVSSETDALNNKTNYTYNTLGKLKQRIRPEVSDLKTESGTLQTARPTENYDYDLSGRLVAVQDANGNLNKLSLLAGTGYGGSDVKVVKEFHADGGVLTNGYDAYGDQITQTNELADQANEVGYTEYFVYDAMGRLTTQTHQARAGIAMLTDYYTYDGLGQRIIHRTGMSANAPTELTSYDAEGRIVGTTDLDGNATSITYAWSSSAGTTGLGTFGAWIKTTVNAAGLTSITKTDYAGRTVGMTDFGGHMANYIYNLAGELVQLTSPAGENMTYSYDNTGKVSSVKWTSGSPASGNITTTSYGYDADGNRTSETEILQRNYSGGSSTTIIENATVHWDALGRMEYLHDDGYAGSAPITVNWSYDLNGNVRERRTDYRAMNTAGTISTSNTTEDDWYKYDSMNRFVTTKGTLVNGAIVRGAGGTDFSYDAAGQRKTATKTKTGSDVDGTVSYEERETYSYTEDGYLKEVDVSDGEQVASGTPPAAPSTSRVLAEYTTDGRGNVTGYFEHDSTDQVVYSRIATYDAAGLVTSDEVTAKRSDGTYVTDTTYWYKTDAYGGGVSDNLYFGGVVTRTHVSTVKNNAETSTSDSKFSYVWWDSAKQSTIANIYTTITGWGASTTKTTTTYTTTLSYDANGHLASANIQDGQPRTVSYVTNADGLIVKRDVSLQSGGAAPHELHYYFTDVAIGDITNNGTSDTDYVTSAAAHVTAPGNGVFRGGATSGTSYADFDQSYDPINGYDSQGAGSVYTAAAGDTLASIAQAVWGDSSLWYLIADANGLSAGSELAAGQTLLIPNKVHNIHNSSSTYKVYDPNTATGDINPMLQPVPKPKSNSGCGVFGQIVLAVVAIAVTVLTYGAASELVGATLLGSQTLAGAAAGAIAGVAGSVVSQGIGLATGIQSSFNWGAVAMAAIGGAVGGGINEWGGFDDVGNAIGKATGLWDIGGYVGDALQGVASSAITQGIGVASGLQSKFDWAGVAAAGVGAGLGSWAGGTLSELGGVWGSTVNGLTVASGLTQFVSGMASDIANAATRTLVNGSDFGDNILAALPDTIGQTIGNMVAGGITSKEEILGGPGDDGPATGATAGAAAVSPEAAQWAAAHGMDIGKVTDNIIDDAEESPDFDSATMAAEAVNQYKGQVPQPILDTMQRIVAGRLQLDGYLGGGADLSSDELSNIASFKGVLQAAPTALTATDLANLTGEEKYYYGVGIVLAKAYDDPNVIGRLDAMEQGTSGEPIVVGLRVATPETDNHGLGTYDDVMIVMQRDGSGVESGSSFYYNADPSGQYDVRAQKNGKALVYGTNMTKAERAAWSAVHFNKPEGYDINGDGILDEGALAADSYYFEPKSGGYLKSTYYGGHNAPAWRSADTEGADRIIGFDGLPSYSDGDFDSTHAGNTMYFHIGGNNNRTWSAGCQTVPGNQYRNFVTALGGRNNSFYYVLVNTHGG